jgi:hypothetical protein
MDTSIPENSTLVARLRKAAAGSGFWFKIKFADWQFKKPYLKIKQ